MMVAADHRAHVYVVASVAVMLVFVVLVGGFCALVDPYGILGSPILAGLTADKPAAADRPRLSKPYRVAQFKPRSLLIGSSALNIGIDPTSLDVPPALQPMYNLGIDGASMEAQRLFLLHALSETHPRMVMLFVSFEDMLAPPTGWAGINGDDFERRLRVLGDGSPNPAFRLAQLQDFVFATFSLQAVKQSIDTLLEQNNPTLNKQATDGYEKRDRLASWSSNQGPLALIQTSFAMRIVNYGETGGHPEYRLGAFTAAIRSAREAGAEVVVVIQPTYAAGLELRRQLGMSDQADKWLVALVAAAEQVAGETGGLGHVAVWNFGGFTPFNQEPLPHSGDRTQLRWFFEAIHFRPDLGTLIMNLVLNASGPPGLGTQVTSATIAADVQRFRTAQKEWVVHHPGEVAEVSRLRRIAQEEVCRSSKRTCDGIPSDQ